MLLRARYLVPVESYSRVRGLPISLGEMEQDIIEVLDAMDTDEEESR